MSHPPPPTERNGHKEGEEEQDGAGTCSGSGSTFMVGEEVAKRRAGGVGMKKSGGRVRRG